MAVSASRPVSTETLGAWVIKCHPGKTALEPMLAAGRATRHWCVADNYRTRLMQPGQRVLFWVAAHPRRGFWGEGRIDGTPVVHEDRWQVATDIALFEEPITAVALRAIRDIAAMEVFRSPQQSNPSWVTRDELMSLTPLLDRAEKFASRHL